MSRESIRARVEAGRFAGWSALRGMHLLNSCQDHGPVENCQRPEYQRDVKALQDLDALLPALLAVADAAADFERMATEHRSLNYAAPEFVILRDALNRLEALP